MPAASSRAKIVTVRRLLVTTSLAACGALLLAGCEEKKAAKTTPPPAATAPAIIASTDPPPPVKIAEAPKADPVPPMIERAEAEYTSGEANYKAGHLEAARTNFDRAVDILMQGPVDIPSDERLRAEFDKIVERVHSLEMVAFK